MTVPTHAHMGNEDMPVHAPPYRRKVCPYRRKHNKATTATEWQNGRTENKQRRGERTEEATHNRGEAQHTQKQNAKKKHTQHAQETTTAPAAETQVQVCYMPRYATQRTQDKYDNHANKLDHNPDTCQPPHPCPHAPLDRERKRAKGMPARACRRKNHTTTAANKQNVMEECEGRQE